MLIGVDVNLQPVDPIDEDTAIKKELCSVGFDPNVAAASEKLFQLICQIV